MKKIIALVAAVVFTLTATISAPAGQLPVTSAPASVPTTGPWIVGGMGFGVLSVIVRAGYVGKSENRELTSGEAMGAFLLPFFWTIFPGDFVKQPQHRRRDGSITAYEYKYQEKQHRTFYDALIGAVPTTSGPGAVAPSSSKPPKPGAPTVGGSGGSQKN